MSVHPTIAAPTRRPATWLVVAGVVVAAGVLAAVLAFALDNGTATAASSSQLKVSSAAQDARRVPSIMSLTPARLAAGALGSGYALPAVRSGPTMASVLASMSPETRRWTEAVMALTFRQLAAGAAGHP